MAKIKCTTAKETGRYLSDRSPLDREVDLEVETRWLFPPKSYQPQLV